MGVEEECVGELDGRGGLGGDGCGYAVEDAVVGTRYDLDRYGSLRPRFGSGFCFLARQVCDGVRRLAVGVALSFRHSGYVLRSEEKLKLETFSAGVGFVEPWAASRDSLIVGIPSSGSQNLR